MTNSLQVIVLFVFLQVMVVCHLLVGTNRDRRVKEESEVVRQIRVG